MINKNSSAGVNDINEFKKSIDFTLPIEFIDFYLQTDGIEILYDERSIILWSLKDIIVLNVEYKVNDFLPEFFFIGTNGSDSAYAIKKITGEIFEIPFIGMLIEESTLAYKSFRDFLKVEGL